MNATGPRHQPSMRPVPAPTHTFWPAGRRPDPASVKPARPDDRPAGTVDGDHDADEPGYGHGV
jgi:hypothetical protein